MELVEGELDIILVRTEKTAASVRTDQLGIWGRGLDLASHKALQ